MVRRKQPLPVFFLLCLLSLAPAAAQETPVAAQETAKNFTTDFASLAPRYQQWVRSVLGLITQQELEYFLALGEDYRRDAFQEVFWEPRDPDPRTPRHELRERWEEYHRQGGGFPPGDPRYLLYLLNGPPGGWTLPNGVPASRCFSASKALEIWFYQGSERTSDRFVVVFQRRSTQQPYEVYLPGGDIRPVQRQGGLPSANVQQLCAEELLGYALSQVRRKGGYDDFVKELIQPPAPSPEWLTNLARRSADLPEGATTFGLEAQITFPGRKQSRTAVQMLLIVLIEEAPGRSFDERSFHDFRLIGEVIKGDSLFESFRYRFEGPTPEQAVAIPLGVTRYLRPGKVTLRLLLEDVFSGRFAQVIREIEVPSPAGRPAVASDRAAAVLSGPSLRLAAPRGDVQLGKVRFRAVATGEIEKVTFYLDDKQLLSKRRPPYSVEIDLGEAAAPHRVRVVGFTEDREVATDQLWLNQGAAERFRVHLVEPRAEGIYPGGITARVEVQTPDGSSPQRLELYLDDHLAATLRAPPFARALELPGSGAVVVRAVAYLSDGSSAEDVVVVGTSTFGETIEVRLVELPVVVTNARGESIPGLDRDRFQVFENGVEQRIERFGPASEGPLTAALLVDTSVSMAPHLRRVVQAASLFVQTAKETPEDRVAVFSFGDRLTVDAGLQASPVEVERALARLVAEGRTAFYDSLVQALNTLEGEGAATLVVFSDGQDETSRLSFDEVLATVRRSAVTIHIVALAPAFADDERRRPLTLLASETGGQAVFLTDLDELASVYAVLLAELRSRYFLAYTPVPWNGSERSREIRVEVDVEGARVRAPLRLDPRR